MVRAHYKVLQDFLNMLLMGVVTGVVFSLALTGAVFLLSGSARAAEEPQVMGSPSEAGQGSLLVLQAAGRISHSYRATGMQIVAKSETRVLLPSERAQLTLVTCSFRRAGVTRPGTGGVFAQRV